MLEVSFFIDLGIKIKLCSKWYPLVSFFPIWYLEVDRCPLLVLGSASILDCSSTNAKRDLDLHYWILQHWYLAKNLIVCVILVPTTISLPMIQPRLLQIFLNLAVTQCCYQLFNVLHEGVSAMFSEFLAGIGAHISSGFKKISRIELNINHLKVIYLGMIVYAYEKSIYAGKRVQSTIFGDLDNFFIHI